MEYEIEEDGALFDESNNPSLDRARRRPSTSPWRKRPEVRPATVAENEAA